MEHFGFDFFAITLLLFAVPNAYCCWFTWSMDLLEFSSVVRIVYTLPLVALSLSFTLMIFIFVAFAYDFHLKQY